MINFANIKTHHLTRKFRGERSRFFRLCKHSYFIPFYLKTFPYVFPSNPTPIQSLLIAAITIKKALFLSSPVMKMTFIIYPNRQTIKPSAPENRRPHNYLSTAHKTNDYLHLLTTISISGRLKLYWIIKSYPPAAAAASPGH